MITASIAAAALAAAAVVSPAADSGLTAHQHHINHVNLMHRQMSDMYIKDGHNPELAKEIFDNYRRRKAGQPSYEDFWTLPRTAHWKHIAHLINRHPQDGNRFSPGFDPSPPWLDELAAEVRASTPIQKEQS